MRTSTYTCDPYGMCIKDHGAFHICGHSSGEKLSGDGFFGIRAGDQDLEGGPVGREKCKYPVCGIRRGSGGVGHKDR